MLRASVHAMARDKVVGGTACDSSCSGIVNARCIQFTGSSTHQTTTERPAVCCTPSPTAHALPAFRQVVRDRRQAQRPRHRAAVASHGSSIAASACCGRVMRRLHGQGASGGACETHQLAHHHRVVVSSSSSSCGSRPAALLRCLAQQARSTSSSRRQAAAAAAACVAPSHHTPASPANAGAA